MGFHFGIGGVITFKNAKKLVEAVEYIPMDRIVLETDCPYMAPVPYRGKRCDSSMIIEIAKKAALIKEVDVEQLLEITCKNAEEFFGIDK